MPALPWQRVRVEGYSMTPTLLPGDWLLVRHGGAVRPGLIVLATFPSRPGLHVVKRASATASDGWLVASDNPDQGTDSRQLGPADVLAIAVWHWPTGRVAQPRRRRLRAWLGRRPPGGIAHV